MEIHQEVDHCGHRLVETLGRLENVSLQLDFVLLIRDLISFVVFHLNHNVAIKDDLSQQEAQLGKELIKKRVFLDLARIYVREHDFEDI